MITDVDIKSLGFEYSPTLSTDEVTTYLYVVDRTDKPHGSQNIYRLDRLTDTDYFSLISDLERVPEFKMFTRGYNGDLADITELFNLFESFKSANSKI